MGEFVDRKTEEYKNLSEKYSKKRDEYKQYFRLYMVRLEKATQYLLQEIQRKWNNEYPICKLYRLSEETYDKCVVIGTLFKNQKLKPSVLKQLSEANSLLPQPVYSHRTDDSDTLHIEDELQRFKLVVSDKSIGFDPKVLVTGICCALLGSDIGQGKFEVSDYLFLGYRNQIERPISEFSNYVVFTSGLDFINSHKHNLNLKLFIDWIGGYLGDINEINPANIVRVIIAGNSIKKTDESMIQKFTMTTRTNRCSDTIEAVKAFDCFLLELTQLIEVDVMPGSCDPSNFALPQKPLHHCLFPKSILYKSMNPVTNPYECEIGGTRISGSAGQPIDNILLYSDITEPVDALENCLKWGHFAPTAPDTLGCFPCYDDDPFFIEDCPHVLFAGNQKKFSTKEAHGQSGQKVRLITVPEFSTTSSVCILNLKNLECSEIVFC